MTHIYINQLLLSLTFRNSHPKDSSVPLKKVESEDKFERIGGSSIGGGTFWGLGALLTKTKVY